MEQSRYIFRCRYQSAKIDGPTNALFASINRIKCRRALNALWHLHRTQDLSLFPFFYCPLIVHKSSTSTCIKPFYGFCLSFQYFNSRFPFGNPLEITVTGVSAYSDGTCNNKMVHALICTCMHWLDLALPSHDFSYFYISIPSFKGPRVLWAVCKWKMHVTDWWRHFPLTQ